ncbi:MAG: aspartyl protease family protein [Acidobacteriia bacterium]|nr:aspartyl protease family protein [Terriglobia bacterium]
MNIQGLSRIAIAFFASALSGAPVEDTLVLARKALMNEGVATAWRLSQKALADAPASAAAHELTGEVLFRRGEFAAAGDEFNLALKLDPNFASAWWGLAQIAECSSMHKTAAADLQRAYSIDPGDPRIFRDWAARLPGRQRIAAIEKYASMVDPGRDEKQLEELRQHIRLQRALQGRVVMALASPYQKCEIPLVNLINSATHTLYYGLEVNLGGTRLRLVLDTGASGILIPRWAASRAGVAELAGATFGGLGDNSKPSGGYHGIVDRLRIGDVEFRDALISVSSQDSVGTADGLIGTNVFSPFLVTLDFAARKLRLDPLPGYHPGDNELRDRSTLPELQHFAPVFRFGHLLLVPTRVSDSREVLFVLDTGADRTLISYDMAAEVSRVSRDDRMRLAGINGQVADLYQTGNLYLQFAGFRQKNLGMTAVDLWPQSRNLGTEVSGFLGLPVLSLFTLTIDYRDGLVHFDRHEP